MRIVKLLLVFVISVAVAGLSGCSTGDVGPAGPKGPQGPQGPQGPGSDPGSGSGGGGGPVDTPCESIDYCRADFSCEVEISQRASKDYNGGDGDDVVCGDGRDNVIDASLGDDFVFAGAGDDTIHSGAGDDIFCGGEGSDTITYPLTTVIGAGLRVDLSKCEEQSDGGYGRDILRNIENIKGSNENDILTGNDADNTMEGLEGNDTLIGGAGNDILNGGPGDDIVRAGEGDDIFMEGEGSDSLYGGPGDDTFIYTNDTFRQYDQVVDGGEGIDTIDLSQLWLSPTSGRFIEARLDGSTIVVNVENLIGTNNAFPTTMGVDRFYGSEFDNVIKGLAGEDLLEGYGGNDTLYGGTHNDTLNGGDGDDTLHGGEDDDTLSGGNGNDTLNGDAGNDTLTGDDGDDVLNGGAGDDTLSGGEGDDTLNGGEGSDQFSGGAGDDIIDAVDGAEDAVIVGNEDDDTFYLDPQDTANVRGASNLGTDTASYERYELPENTDMPAISIGDRASLEHIIGSNYDDTITFSNTGNKGTADAPLTINGGPGDDSVGISGDSGNVTFIVKAGEGNDTITSDYKAGYKLSFEGFPSGTTAGVDSVGSSYVVRVGDQTVKVNTSSLTDMDAFGATITVN